MADAPQGNMTDADKLKSLFDYTKYPPRRLHNHCIDFGRNAGLKRARITIDISVTHVDVDLARIAGTGWHVGWNRGLNTSISNNV